jgi:hypothetical protein
VARTDVQRADRTSLRTRGWGARVGDRSEPPTGRAVPNRWHPVYGRASRDDGHTVISIELAEQLRAAGLAWEPAEGDRFALPDRDLDERVFTISHMVVEVRTAATGRIIAFNGTTEWALDAVEQAEVVWLPREGQLREALGEALLSLARTDHGWRCTFRSGDRLAEADAVDAAEAYGQALLRILGPG